MATGEMQDTMSDTILKGLSYLKVLSDEMQKQLLKKDDGIDVESSLDSTVEYCPQEVKGENNEPSVAAAQELIKAEREKIRKAKENSLKEMEIIKEKLAEEKALNDHLKNLIDKHENCGYGAWFKMMKEESKCVEDFEALRRDIDKFQYHEITVLEANSQLLTESQEMLIKSLEKWICEQQSLLQNLQHKERLLKISIDAEEDKQKLISSDIKKTWCYIAQYRNEVSHNSFIEKMALKKEEDLVMQAKKLTSAAQNECKTI